MAKRIVVGAAAPGAPLAAGGSTAGGSAPAGAAAAGLSAGFSAGGLLGAGVGAAGGAHAARSALLPSATRAPTMRRRDHARPRSCHGATPSRLPRSRRPARSSSGRRPACQAGARLVGAGAVWPVAGATVPPAAVSVRLRGARSVARSGSEGGVTRGRSGRGAPAGQGRRDGGRRRAARPSELCPDPRQPAQRWDGGSFFQGLPLPGREAPPFPYPDRLRQRRRGPRSRRAPGRRARRLVYSMVGTARSRASTRPDSCACECHPDLGRGGGLVRLMTVR